MQSVRPNCSVAINAARHGGAGTGTGRAEHRIHISASTVGRCFSLITIMSSLSQEESRSISENVRWGIKKRMSDGKYSVTYSHFIGYDRGADGKMVINENEANIVRFIFRFRLQGYSDTATANRLMELGVPAPYGGKKWSPTVVRHMLSNEKMKGDALIQKSYVADFLDKRQRKNKGEVQQYYVTGGL